MASPGLMPIIVPTETDYDLRREASVQKRDGTLIRDKARMIVEELFLVKAIHVMDDPDIPDSQKLEWIKPVIQMADVLPKQNAVPTGGGFHINIVLPDPSTLPPSQSPLLNVSPSTTVPAFTPPTFTPAAPVEAVGSQGFRVPDFVGMGLKPDNNLVGPPIPQPPKVTP